MPFQPPTRPHSANPHAVLNSALFPTSSASSSRPASHRSISHQPSGSYSRISGSEWEDAWDSSSDKEDHEDQSSRQQRSAPTAKAVPIPAPRRAGVDNGMSGAVGSGSGSSGAAASWTSASFQHVSHPVESPNGSDLAKGAQESDKATGGPKLERPVLLGLKTYADASTAPEPGTAGMNGAGKGRGPKLPPGGSWELVEEAELKEEVTVPVLQPGKEAVRDDVDDILRDPLQLLHSLSITAPSTPTSSAPQRANPSSNFPFLSPVTPTSSGSRGVTSLSYASPPDVSVSQKVPASRKEAVSRQRSVRTERKREKFGKVLKGKPENGGGVDLAELKRLAWSGVPNEVRPIVWQLLLNYLPLPTQPRLTTLNRKRKEYTQLVDQYFGRGLSSLDQQIWHQIEIDVPRTRPGVPLWSCITAQRALERILYVWAIRHPASGYVQGINDLVCPFFQIFLNAYIETDPELFDVIHLPAEALSAIEADTFWCLSKLLDGIQDNYISQQPGIQRLVKRMGDLVKRIDAPLAAHFDDQGVEFMQFAFRWMNCLLMREISVKCTIRMWDTYLAEGTDAFSQFHLYVCSALLVKYSERLREMDFQEMIIFLQNLPTQQWNDHDIELLLSEAYVLKTVWQGAENHFANLPTNGQGGGFGMLGR